MAMTLRLTPDDDHALVLLAEADGVSKQEATVRAIHEAASRRLRGARSALCRPGPGRGAPTCWTAWASDRVPPLWEVLALIHNLEVGTIRDVGLLDSAVHRPPATVFGVDDYPGIDQRLP